MLTQLDKSVLMVLALIFEDFDIKTDEEIMLRLKEFLKNQTEKQYTDNELMDCVKCARFRIAVAKENVKE